MTPLNIIILVLAVACIFFNMQRYYMLFINSRFPYNGLDILEDMRNASALVIPWLILIAFNLPLLPITLVAVLITIFLYLGGIVLYIL